MTGAIIKIQTGRKVPINFAQWMMRPSLGCDLIDFAALSNAEMPDDKPEVHAHTSGMSHHQLQARCYMLDLLHQQQQYASQHAGQHAYSLHLYAATSSLFFIFKQVACVSMPQHSSCSP
jgi:hypothetical protein